MNGKLFYGALAVLALIVLFCRTPALIVIVMVCYLFLAQNVSQRQEIPEIMYFLPIGEEERRERILYRTLLEAGRAALAFLLAWLCLLTPPLARGGAGIPEIGRSLLVASAYFFAFWQRLLLIENAKYRNLNVTACLKLCCPPGRRVLYRCSLVLQYAVLGALGCLPGITIPAAGAGGILLLLAICSVWTGRYLLSITDRGDRSLSFLETDITE